MRGLARKVVRFFSYIRSYSANRWRYLFYTLPRKDKTRIAVLLLVAGLVSFTASGYDYWVLRSPAPAHGGSYTEGIVGSPRYINPVLSTNNETDRDVAELVFAGLTKHNKDGEIVGDLAKSFTVDARGRVYKFTLRENLQWPDGEPLTSEDVLFTINLIQNPEYRSPLRSTWQGVRAEALDKRTVQLTLNLPYAPFLENTTVGILPKHHWEAIEPQNFALAELNIKPVGSGPYAVHKIVKDGTGSIRSLELQRNEAFYNPAYLDNIILHFYPSQDELVDAFKGGAVDGMSLLSPQISQGIKKGNTTTYSLRMPRYFALFFNESQNSALSSQEVRAALAHATPKEQIVNQALNGEAHIQDGPFPNWLLSEDTASSSSSTDQEHYVEYPFNQERARTLLADAGWHTPEEETETPLRANEDGEPLTITLTTTDFPELTKTATILQDAWRAVGAQVNLDVIPISNIQEQAIRPREYEVLLFGEVLSIHPDPFSFWHSSQQEDPGLNLAGYKNERVDALLEAARQAQEKEERQDHFREIQQIITRDLPAVFLYNPSYLYILPKNINGFKKTILGAPDERFENVPAWYSETKRVK